MSSPESPCSVCGLCPPYEDDDDEELAIPLGLQRVYIEPRELRAMSVRSSANSSRQRGPIPQGARVLLKI